MVRTYLPGRNDGHALRHGRVRPLAPTLDQRPTCLYHDEEKAEHVAMVVRACRRHFADDVRQNDGSRAVAVSEYLVPAVIVYFL